MDCQVYFRLHLDRCLNSASGISGGAVARMLVLARNPPKSAMKLPLKLFFRALDIACGEQAPLHSHSNLPLIDVDLGRSEVIRRAIIG